MSSLHDFGAMSPAPKKNSKVKTGLGIAAIVIALVGALYVGTAMRQNAELAPTVSTTSSPTK